MLDPSEIPFIKNQEIFASISRRKIYSKTIPQLTSLTERRHSNIPQTKIKNIYDERRPYIEWWRESTKSNSSKHIYSALRANPICKHSQLNPVNGWFYSLATLRDSDTVNWRDVVVS